MNFIQIISSVSNDSVQHEYAGLLSKNISTSSYLGSANSFNSNSSVYYKYSFRYMSKRFYFQQFCLTWVCSLSIKTVLFQVIEFSISTQFSSVWPIDNTLSGATTPGQSGPGSDGNEGLLRIPESSSITETSIWYCFVSYPGHSLGEGYYPSAEVLSVYSAFPVDLANVYVCTY